MGEVFRKKEDGEYYESQNFVVTSQIGHLLELLDISNYLENKGKNMWQTKNLPFFPGKYKYVLKKDVKQRFETIKTLLNREDVDEVINCGDPDREGQVLVDLVLIQLGCKKKITRPLLKALTPEAIVKEFNERQPNNNYLNWRNEGLVRMYVDNDYGKNLSRYATAKTFAKPALNVGRVIGAIVIEIYNRDMQIKNFVPVKYYKIESDINGIKLTSKKQFVLNDKRTAGGYAETLNMADALIIGLEKKKIIKGSPKLFSQTSLQAALNKKFGFSPDKTLQVAQALYEKGFTTYPRTNTEYIAEDEKSDIAAIVETHNSDGNLTFKDNKKIFDNSKIEGHSAITPTKAMASKLSDDEQKCYETILNRFMAVFCAGDCVYDQTVAVVNCGDIEEFKLKGEILVKPGWQIYENISKEDKILPMLEKRQKIETDFCFYEAETVPQKSYTVESLGKWMQNPFRKNSDTDDEEYKNILSGLEIGTEATRAGIKRTVLIVL